ncbi:MAG: hypothetical protein EA378_11680 [Phycisphaerales bacterium]|nr:MAG: hypothetical protein EA378_11680 [Phycisphaerales bacterium]
MKAISQFVVHVFDLIEAEGVALRSAVRSEAQRARETSADVATGFALLLTSVPVLLAGFGLLAAGMMWWLETIVSRPLAAGITGAVALVLGGALLFTFRQIARRRT